MARRKLKRPVTLAGGSGSPPSAHDRRATDLPMNARVAPIEVVDPYPDRDGHKGKLIVMRSLRDDPLGAMHNAKQIEEYQYQAGRKWQEAFELSQGCGYKALDPAKEYVDGGQIAQSTLTERQAQAVQDMKRFNKALGREGEGIVLDVLGRGATVRLAAESRCGFSKSDREYIGRRFRECLTTIAKECGLCSQNLQPTHTG